MIPKIIYMTNIDRRYFMMRRALDELIADGEMPASSQVVKTEDSSVWSASWEEKLRGSALVMIRFMGNTIRTKFWTACMHFLSREGIPYYGAAVADLLGGDLSSGDGEEIHDGSFPV